MVGGSTNYRGGRADSTRLWGTLGHGDGRCRINTSGNNLAILTNNSLTEDSFGCDLLAGGGNHLFTVLGHHSVYNVIELLVANLPRDLHLPWNTGGLWYTVAFWLVNCKGCVASQELRVGIRVSVRLSSSFSPDSRGAEPHGEQDKGEEVHDDDGAGLKLSRLVCFCVRSYENFPLLLTVSVYQKVLKQSVSIKCGGHGWGELGL